MPATLLSSPESSPHRSGYGSSPPTSLELPRCDALVAGTLAPCTRPRSRGPTMYCGPHSKEHRQLYRAYKKLSAEVEDLKNKGWLSPNVRGMLRTLQQVERAIDRAERWRDKIPKEIEARRTHHDHFFPMQYEEGHEKWIRGLQTDLVNAQGLVDWLLTRKDKEERRPAEEEEWECKLWRLRRQNRLAAKARAEPAQSSYSAPIRSWPALEYLQDKTPTDSQRPRSTPKATGTDEPYTPDDTPGSIWGIVAAGAVGLLSWWMRSRR